MLTVLIGAPGSGKSTFASDSAAAGAVVLSLDAARAIVGTHEGDQTATAAAVDYTIRLAHQTLTEGRPVVIDATSTTAPERATWLDIARERRVPARAVVLDTPLPVCLARNSTRPPHRRVPEEIVVRMWWAVHALADTTLVDEGFAHVCALAALDAAAHWTAQQMDETTEENMLAATQLGLPLDGPHTPDNILDAARAVSDLVHYLARATTDASVTGEALDGVLLGLLDTARGLDQVLQQVSNAALTLRADGSLRDDRGDAVDPADTAETVADATAEARTRLAAVTTALQDAASAATHLGRDVDPAEDDESEVAGR